MLTTRDAAARLGLTPQSVARLCKQGQIRAERIGRDYLIPEDELARFAALTRPAHRPRKDRTMKTYRYQPINAIGATDLNQELTEAQRLDQPAELYAITIYDASGVIQHPEGAEALYLPGEGRLGIAWGADATWADVKDVESGIGMWLNDGPAWEAAN